MQGFIRQPGEPEIPNLDLPGRRDHDIRRLEVTMQNPVRVQVLTPVEQLKHNALDRARRDGMPRLLRMVVNNLQQIMLCILEHHKDALILENDLNQLDNVGVTQLRAERHLADGRLRNARVGGLLSLFVGLELLDGEFTRLALAAEGLVDATIGAAADEADDLVLVGHADFALVAHRPAVGVWERLASTLNHA